MEALQGYTSDTDEEDRLEAMEIAHDVDERDNDRRSRSRSLGRSEMPEPFNIAVYRGPEYVPQLEIDDLPTRINDPHRQCRLVPEGPQPKAIRGLRLQELATLIKRCGFQGEWRQGGKQARAVFVGDKFIINQEKSSTWVQGRRAQEIDARLRAARSGQ